MKFVFATTAALATLALGQQQHLLSVETVNGLVEQNLLSLGVGDGYIVQTFQPEVDATQSLDYREYDDEYITSNSADVTLKPGQQSWITMSHKDGYQGINYLKVTQTGGGPICVQVTQRKEDHHTDWSSYYESHSTDQSGCTNWNNHRFGVVLDNLDPHTFRCRDGTATPGTCGGFKWRIHCYSSCSWNYTLAYTLPPVVSSFVPAASLDALVEQRSLGAASEHSVVSHFGDGHINQTFELEVNATDGGYLTINHPDGLFQSVNDLKVTHLSGGALCVQATEDAGDVGDWSGYYESHSTDQSGCTNGNNHRFGVALDNWNRTTFRCRDGTAAPGTCRGIKLRVHCYSDCTFEVMFDATTPPIVSSLRVVIPIEPSPPTLTPTRSPTNYDDAADAAELSTAALSGIVAGCVAGVGLLAGGAYAMKNKQSSEGARQLLV